MLSVRARAVFGTVVNPMGRALARAGVSPDVVTVIGTAGTVATSLVFFPRGWFFFGAAIAGLFACFDMLDGAVARASGRSTKFGAVLDSTCDRVADAAVFSGFAWFFADHGEHWLLAASLLCLVLGSVTSYIRARAEGAGMTASVGIAERTDRLIIVLVGLGLSAWPTHVPYLQPVTLWGLVAASMVTVIQRLVTVHQQSRAFELDA